MTATGLNWVSCKDELPQVDVVVMTKIDDTNGDQRSLGCNAVVTLGFEMCGDKRWRRSRVHDGLSLEVDDYRITVYAENESQSLRLQIASFAPDGLRFEQWLSLTDGNA